MQTIQENKIAEIIDGTISALGYELVRVKMMGGAKSVKLQIMADRTDGKNMLVEDCEKISREISVILDVEDPITENYELEVSSPGIDRPLMKKKDFEAHVGDIAKISCKIPLLENMRKIRGRINEVEEASVFLEAEDGKIWQIEFDNIEDAKLVLTDELIKKYMKKEEDKNHG